MTISIFSCTLILFFIAAFVMFLELNEVGPISNELARQNIEKLSFAKKKLKSFTELMSIMPSKKTLKWIVVTSIQAPTDDVKRLAAYSDWTLVVVGDEKTPEDWNLPDVHFLSLEIQEAMDFATIQKLPKKSYTRKNAGYLYAIANGAQWIYDTDDDNKPFGKGLDQFDYSTDKSRGLRFTVLDSPNTTVQECLFNPYRHFGRPDMWPRGFPLEHIKNHDHKDGSYRLCRVQRPSAVQQGIVKKDPDVDAIYRLLHAIPSSGLDESFNKFAPPVVLAPGTYAPWNSQNTLFSRSAFFGLFLPTTVAFRVTDIWRSYFTQALLHAAGETVSFVPVNAIQQRNAHSYINDFDDEIDVYNKAGEIVHFINHWECNAKSLDKCAIELAEHFSSHGFWREEDARLVVLWIADLQKIGYVFPELRPGARADYPIGEDSDVRRNCRRAHISINNNIRAADKNEMEVRAEAKIKNYGDLKKWCDISSSTKSKEWLFPAPQFLANATAENKTLHDNYQLVAIITNNYQWKMGMGMLQRMYDENFALLIFCGHYPKQGDDADEKEFPEGMARGDMNFPKLIKPINYIDLSNEEVHMGYLMYYCLAKLEEMKFQNVKGYVMFSDDMIYNFWNPINLNLVQGNKRTFAVGHWWRGDYGYKAMNRTIQLIKGKYNNDPEVLKFVDDLKYQFGMLKKKELYQYATNFSDPFHYLMNGDGWVIGDWMYIPTSNISFVSSFAQLAHEGQLFHELFTSKILHLLPSEGGARTDPNRFIFMWGRDRSNWANTYNENMHGIHPIKLSQFQIDKERARFCDVVLDKFYRNTFRIGNWSN